MIVDRSLSKAVVLGALITLVALAGVGFFLTFLSQLHNIGTGDYTVSTAFLFAALALPQTVYDMFPVATLIGALFALGGLAAHQELMILRVSGADLWRLGRAAVWGGLALALLTVLLGEFVAPPAKRIAEIVRVQKMYSRINTVGAKGVWIKSGEEVVHVSDVVSATELGQLKIYTLGQGNRIKAVRRAKKATYESGHWVLHDVSGTRFKAGQTHKIAARRMDWTAFVVPSTFKVLAVNPGDLSWRGLSRYIGYLRANGLSSSRYETAFWHKIAVPVSVLLMVLLALPFALGRVRGGGAGQRLALGVVIGLVYYLIDRTVLEAGEGFRIAPLVTAWLPTALLAIAVSIAMRRAR